MNLKIVNVIASARIKGSFDIEAIALKFSGIAYEPEIFSGLVLRRKGQPTMIFFASGKISSHGSKSEDEGTSNISKMLKEVDDKGCVLGNPQIDWIRIENMVGTATFEKVIDLEQVYSCLPSAIYEPEQFPGLIYRPLKNSVTCLVFTSGKLIFVGGKSKKQLEEALLTMENLLYTI